MIGDFPQIQGGQQIFCFEFNLWASLNLRETSSEFTYSVLMGIFNR